MEKLLRKLDVEKLARLLPEGPDRDCAIERALELNLYARRAVEQAEAGEEDASADNGAEVMRSSGGGSGSGKGSGGRR